MTDVPLCPGCGHRIEAADQFCPNCGAALARASIEVHTAADDQPAPGAEQAPAESPWEAVLTQLRAVTNGRFEIEKELGEGGMAAVYLAYEPALDRRVAIKVMSPALLMERGMVGRFKQEAVTIAALKHPNIVTVHGVEHHDQLHFFVLDFVERGSLDHVMRHYGPLPVPVVRAWLAQIASALEYAHRRGVVHRDVKPANVLLDGEGNAIVTDFGIAKVAERVGFTMTGATVGTPSYMSPEQCLAQPVTGASDQYSLGIVAYAMLTGGPPFRGSTLEIMRAHTDVAPVPVTTLRPDCPPDLAHVVTRMLEKDAARRWPNLAEALAAYHGAPPGLHDPVCDLMAALARGERLSVAASADTPTTPLPDLAPVSKRTRPLAMKLGLGVVGAAAAVGVLVMTLGRHAGPEPVPAPPRTAVAESVATAPPREDTVRSPGPAPAPAPPSAVLATVRVSPSGLSLSVGETGQLRALPLDASGRSVSAGRVEWSARDPAVASVTRDGQVTGRAAGTTQVTATISGKTASVLVTVSPEAVASVTVIPARAELQPGQTAQLAAQALGARGTALDRPVEWRSAESGVASVSASGMVTAVAPGVALVSATVEGRLGQATITVRAPAPAPPAAAPAAIDVAEATRQIDRWIRDFVTRLDAAVQRKDLAAVRAAYQVPMPEDDQTEWQKRLSVDAHWRAHASPTNLPPKRVGGVWVSEFEVEFEVETSGRTRRSTNSFFAEFEPGPNGLTLISLDLRLR
jgi:hypothetical protein